ATMTRSTMGLSTSSGRIAEPKACQPGAWIATSGLLLNSGWIAARRRASARYREEFGKEPPKGFQRVRARDLRHTYGRRLRAAGVSLEDRQDLLGHEAGRVTTHCSSAEVANLVKAANAVKKSREYPTHTVCRLISSEG